MIKFVHVNSGLLVWKNFHNTPTRHLDFLLRSLEHILGQVEAGPADFTAGVGWHGAESYGSGVGCHGNLK